MQIEQNNVMRFNSISDLHSYMTPAMCYGSTMSEGKWFGNVTSQQACDMLITGDQSQVPAAQTMLDKFDVRIETTGNEMGLSAAGFMPSIPDYLGGAPECMYSMNEVQNNAMPLKVIVDTTSSGGITSEQLSKRGTVILAAVMALAAVRPVTLEAVSSMDCDKQFRFNGNDFCAARVAINSAPIDLGSACLALCNTGFTRRVMYGATEGKYLSPGHWPSRDGKMMMGRDDATNAWYLSMYGEDPETTLYIPTIHLYDTLMTEPEKWITEVLAKYSH